MISADLISHLERYTASPGTALVFTSPNGAPLRNSNFRRRIWIKAVKDAQLPATHFHDLRHTGNNLTAASGATLRELMDRMGHTSTRAALIYQHGGIDRQQAVADTMGALAAQMLADGETDSASSGTDMARGDES